MKSPTLLKKLAPCCGFVLLLAGCTTSNTISASTPDLARAARGVAGTDLIGAKGKTTKDQAGIDSTAAGLCAAGSWSKSECARHQRLSRE